MPKSEFLRATKSFKYDGRMVFPGDDLDATPQEAKLLLAIQRVVRRPDRALAALLVAPATPALPPVVEEPVVEPPAPPAEPAAAETTTRVEMQPEVVQVATVVDSDSLPPVEQPADAAAAGEGDAAKAAAAKTTRQRRTAAQ